MTQAPTFGGATLRRPSKHGRQPVPVLSSVQLAGGATSTYHRGFRTVIELSWSNLRAVDAATIDTAARTRGPAPFVDIDGTSYIMNVTGYSGLDAVPGTDPIRYSCSLTMTERAPR